MGCLHIDRSPGSAAGRKTCLVRCYVMGGRRREIRVLMGGGRLEMKMTLLVRRAGAVIMYVPTTNSALSTMQM